MLFLYVYAAGGSSKQIDDFHFQINSLEFDQNVEIIAMISCEGEVVPMAKKIIPNAANVCIFIRFLYQNTYTPT